LTQYLSHGTRKDEIQVEEEVEDIEGESAASANAGP
jgi:ATP-dependent Clp protease ATP-binding subunit ClpA